MVHQPGIKEIGKDKEYDDGCNCVSIMCTDRKHGHKGITGTAQTDCIAVKAIERRLCMENGQ